MFERAKAIQLAPSFRVKCSQEYEAWKVVDESVLIATLHSSSS